MTTIDIHPAFTQPARPAPPSPSRLLSTVSPTGDPVDLATHRRTYPRPGTYRTHPRRLVDTIERSGLRGRGGAAFPTAIKLRSVEGRTPPVVVVNATEGEPASAKDRLLTSASPHLVLDGALIIAAVVGATTIRVCVSRERTDTIERLRRAIEERHGREPLPDIAVSVSPAHYVVGEETALVNWLNGADGVPTGVRPTIRGVGGRPTVVDNAETVAHIAQIARFGDEWFRQLGTEDEPGTMLCSVTRADGSRRVVEAGLATPLTVIADVGGATITADTPVLVGGYFGAWITGPEALAATMSNSSLRRYGAAAGCGVIVPLPPNVCGWCETARLLSWMASESAGQCGACVNGLGAISRMATDISAGVDTPHAVAWLERWAGQVDGRGGCRFPDGAVRLLRSALRVHRHALDQHLSRRRCPTLSGPFLPVPDNRWEPWR